MCRKAWQFILCYLLELHGGHQKSDLSWMFLEKPRLKLYFPVLSSQIVHYAALYPHRERYACPFFASWIGLWSITSAISSDSFCFSLYQMMATSVPWPSGWSETLTSPRGVSFFTTPSDTWYEISHGLSEGVSFSFGQSSSQTGRWPDGVLLVTGQVTVTS